MRKHSPTYGHFHDDEPDHSPVSLGLIAILLAVTVFGGVVVVAVESNPTSLPNLAFNAAPAYQQRFDQGPTTAAQASAPPAPERSAAEQAGSASGQ
jgi:hypothetical protein